MDVVFSGLLEVVGIAGFLPVVAGVSVTNSLIINGFSSAVNVFMLSSSGSLQKCSS